MHFHNTGIGVYTTNTFPFTLFWRILKTILMLIKVEYHLMSILYDCIVSLVTAIMGFIDLCLVCGIFLLFLRRSELHVRWMLKYYPLRCRNWRKTKNWTLYSYSWIFAHTQHTGKLMQIYNSLQKFNDLPCESNTFVGSILCHKILQNFEILFK